MTVRATAVPTASVELMWPRLLPWVERFCADSQESYDAAFIFENLKDGTMQAWFMMGDDGILGVTLTEVRQTKIKELIIIVCTGKDMVSWSHLVSELEKYAIQIGCKKICGIARPGWEKILTPLGYKKKHIELEKML